MNSLQKEINQLHARVCQALASPTRILILYTLYESSSNVSDLAEKLDISQPNISRHLNVLKDRRMVSRTRQGQSVIYEIKDKRVIEALDLLRQVLADGLDGQKELTDSINQIVD